MNEDCFSISKLIPMENLFIPSIFYSFNCLFITIFLSLVHDWYFQYCFCCSPTFFTLKIGKTPRRTSYGSYRMYTIWLKFDNRSCMSFIYDTDIKTIQGVFLSIGSAHCCADTEYWRPLFFYIDWLDCKLFASWRFYSLVIPCGIGSRSKIFLFQNWSSGKSHLPYHVWDNKCCSIYIYARACPNVPYFWTSRFPQHPAIPLSENFIRTKLVALPFSTR